MRDKTQSYLFPSWGTLPTLTKKMHAFFGANEESWFEDVERTVTGFLPDKMVTQIF